MTARRSVTPQAMVWMLGLSALGAALGSATTVHAQRLPPRVELEWDAPAGCPDRAAALATLARLLAEAEPRAMEPLVARVVIRATAADAWELHLETVTHGLRGERTLGGGN